MKIANVHSRWLTQGCQLSCISRETHAIDTFHTHSCHMFILLRSENKLQCLDAVYTTLQMKGQYIALHGFDGTFWQFNTSRGMLRACLSLLSLSTGFFFFTAKVFHMNTQCYFISKKATSDKASELFSPSEGKPEHSISTSPFAPCARRQVRASYYGYRNALCCSETFSRFPVTGF